MQEWLQLPFSSRAGDAAALNHRAFANTNLNLNPGRGETIIPAVQDLVLRLKKKKEEVKTLLAETEEGCNCKSENESNARVKQRLEGPHNFLGRKCFHAVSVGVRHKLN